MKCEETKYEETMYEDNQTNSSNETIENQEANIEKVDKPKRASAWRKYSISMGLGILLGSTASLLTSSTNMDPEPEPNPEPELEPNPELDWTDGEVDIATTVNDEMSFSQAFAAARSEVGAGGAFEWRGNVYSTYTAEEWNGMSDEERDTYNEHFRWAQYEVSTSQTSTSSSSATTETTTTGVEAEEPVVEVVEVQETIPEVEILGVAHDDATGANLGMITVENQEYLLVDIDDNGEFDIIASDINDDGEITEDEIGDISGYHMAVSDFESNSFGSSSMYASNDGTMDYANGMDDIYEA